MNQQPATLPRETSLPVEHLFTMTAQTRPAAIIEDAPQGTRRIMAVLGGTFEGDRMKGRIELPAGNWLTQRGNGSVKLDVRVLLRTEDGAAILMSFTGVGRQRQDGFVSHVAPLFETGDPRYAWLNDLQAVAIGRRSGQEPITYEVYALQDPL